MSNGTIKITVRGGVCYVDEDTIPPGVVVRVTDYDIEGGAADEDNDGNPCEIGIYADPMTRLTLALAALDPEEDNVDTLAELVTEAQHIRRLPNAHPVIDDEPAYTPEERA